MTQIALDSSTVVTWVLQERRWQVVDALLNTADSDFVLPGPALTEIVWIARKKGNVSTGDTIAATLRAHGMMVEHCVAADLLRAAELLEISNKNPGPTNPRTNLLAALSLGDATILAITERLNCPIVTRDLYWSWLAAQQLIKVRVQTI